MSLFTTEIQIEYILIINLYEQQLISSLFYLFTGMYVPKTEAKFSWNIVLSKLCTF